MPHTNGNSNNNEAKQCAQICEEVALEFHVFAKSYRQNEIKKLDNQSKTVKQEFAKIMSLTDSDLFTLFINQKQEHGS